MEDDICMLCRADSTEGEELRPCPLCGALWPSHFLVSVLQYFFYSDSFRGCTECRNNFQGDEEDEGGGVDEPSSSDLVGNTMIAKIFAIQADASLTEKEKARKRQELLTQKAVNTEANEAEARRKGKEKGKERGKSQVEEPINERLKCSICWSMLDRPVSTPCGHNFCLKCFQYLTKQSRTCPKCRKSIPPAIINQLRINVTLVRAIRMENMPKLPKGSSGGFKACDHVMLNPMQRQSPLPNGYNENRVTNDPLMGQNSNSRIAIGILESLLEPSRFALRLNVEFLQVSHQGHQRFTNVMGNGSLMPSLQFQAQQPGILGTSYANPSVGNAGMMPNFQFQVQQPGSFGNSYTHQTLMANGGVMPNSQIQAQQPRILGTSYGNQLPSMGNGSMMANFQFHPLQPVVFNCMNNLLAKKELQNLIESQMWKIESYSLEPCEKGTNCADEDLFRITADTDADSEETEIELNIEKPSKQRKLDGWLQRKQFQNC